MSRRGTGPVRGVASTLLVLGGVLTVLLLAGPATLPWGGPTLGGTRSSPELSNVAGADARFHLPAPSSAPDRLGAASLAWSSVQRTMDRALSVVALQGPRPQATSVNLSGFGILGEGANALSNNGVEFNSTIPQLPPGFSGGTNPSSVVICVAGETVTTNVSAVVGFIELSYAGITGALPIYAVNDSGVSIVGTSPITGAMQVGSGPHTFTMAETHSNWWSFTADGALITGGPYTVGNANGSANLQVANTSLLTLSIPAFAYLIPANVTGMPLSQIQTVLNVRSGSSWSAPLLGIEGLDGNIGVAGYLQDPTIPPDTVDFGGNYPVLTAFTILWGSGALPSLVMAEHGFPAPPASPLVAHAGMAVPITVWVNTSSSSSAGVGSALLTTNSTVGASFIGVGTGPSPGEFHLDYVPPSSMAYGNDTVTILATATGYVATRSTYPVTILPSPMTIAIRAPLGPIDSGATVDLGVWTNLTGAGPVDPGSLRATAQGGGTLVLLAATPGTVGYRVAQFTAPMYLRASTSTLTFSASGSGLIPQTATVVFHVELRALDLSGPSSAKVFSGSTLHFPLSVSTNHGALPGATGSWWNVSVRGNAGDFDPPLQGLPNLTYQQSGALALNLTINPGYIGPVWFWVNGSAPGFNSTSATWSEEADGNLTVTVTGWSPSTSVGQQETLVLTVLGLADAPVPGAEIDLAASSGTFGSGGAGSAIAYTDANGQATVPFHLPDAQATTFLTLTIFVNVTYYAPSTTTLGTTATVPAGGTISSSADQLWAMIDLLLALVLMAILLALFAVHRRDPRSRGASGAPAAAAGSSGARWASGSEDDEDLGDEGRAPSPGVPIARYEEEELGSADHPEPEDLPSSRAAARSSAPEEPSTASAEVSGPSPAPSGGAHATEQGPTLSPSTTGPSSPISKAAQTNEDGVSTKDSAPSSSTKGVEPSSAPVAAETQPVQPSGERKDATSESEERSSSTSEGGGSGGSSPSRSSPKKASPSSDRPRKKRTGPA